MTMEFELPYFPRPELTARIQKAVQTRLTNGITMFAPRRLGKTWFVTHELLPAFSNIGWETLSLDLWLRYQDPAGGLVELLEQKAKGAGRLFASLSKVKVRLGVKGAADGEVEVTRSDKGNTEGEEARLERAIDTIASRGKNVLIVFDEFQTLAGNNGARIVPALRAALQRHQGTIFPIYTGSSRGALNSMFKSAGAPFFNSALPIQFSELNRDFVEDRVQLIRDRAPSLNVDVDEFERLFNWLGRSPQHANELAIHAILDVTDDLKVIYSEWVKSKSLGENYENMWEELTAMQQAVLRAVAESTIDGLPAMGLFKESTLEVIRSLVPGGEVSAAKVQTAVKTLQRKHLVAEEAGKGEYSVEDAAFRAFLLDAVELPDGLGTQAPIFGYLSRQASSSSET